MRISDWSSDVCSSDLAFDHVLSPLLTPSRNETTNIRSPKACTLARYTLADNDAHLHSILNITHAPLRKMEIFVPVLERLINNKQRSEEHTSELQSLMRNSYDVLCLKQNIEPIHTLPKQQ